MPQSEITWDCPFCKKETIIFIEIDSPSDYVAETNCEHCGREIKDSNLEDKICLEATEYFIGLADYRD